MVTVGSGWIGVVEVDEGTTFTFNGGTGDFGHIRAWGATNTLNFQNGGDALSLATETIRSRSTPAVLPRSSATPNPGSLSTVSIGANAAAGSIRFSDGGETLNVSGEVNQADLNSSNDTVNVTTGGNIESLAVGDGNDTVTVTDSKIGSLDLGNGTNKLSIAGRLTSFGPMATRP